MSRHTWSGMLVATIFAVSGAVMAQQAPSTPDSPSTPRSPAPTTPPATQAPPTTPSTPPSAPATPQASNESKVSVTGCLREASASPVGTSGSATAAPSTTDAAGKADAANSPASASGTSKYVLADATSASPNGPATEAHESAKKTYQLIANESALTPHLGKKLELTGTIEGQEASASAAAQPAGASASASVQPKLRVESGKIVAADCK